ncbi:MAG TPA: hypothetical protein VFE78_25310 [Gemmataceae bacterium]|nr:hypothetical protein [Gemmataceae bacterium]
MRRLLIAPAMLLALWAAPGGAQPPPAPDVNQDIAVTPAAGPWLICAGSYSGPNAPNLARQLALQVRERHHLNAYVFNHADEERRQLRAEFERMQALHPDVPMRRRTVRLEEQCAVLVGGYKDDTAASAALKKIRTLPLPELKLPNGEPAYDYMLMSVPDPGKQRMTLQRAPVNPFSTAFVIPNPTVPRQQDRPKFDPFWTKLNAYEDYSLLKCPKRYTLVVKEYMGATAVQPHSGVSGLMDMLGLGHKMGEGILGAGKQAHELAKFLRDPRLGFKSYVLHTRSNSIVTVGEFDEINGEEMLRLQRQIAKLRFSPDPRNPNAADPVGLMANPAPMEVPHPDAR